MYLSLNWLKDLVEIPKNISPKELGLRLTMHTVEVDSVETQAEKFDQVVVGKVLEVANHPDADRLRLAKVDVGGESPLKIVCGAPNLEVGQLVPVALIGAQLPNGLTIEKRAVRGEESEGMICAEDELGLGEDHAGIMVLDKGARIGKPFANYLNLDDVVFEVDNKSITNRPDLWGHLGMAREIAVFLEAKNTKKFKNILAGKIEIKSEEELEIKIEDGELCPRYSAIRIEGITVKESPKWLAERLTVAGMRPINNIVDATNYVMLELGQPLHAFDAGIIKKIVVRKAKKGENIKTLDEQARELDSSMLVITDGNSPIAIAGVMGGKESEISEETKEIVLEAANFEAVNTRKTSSKLGLRTEASMRFEKAIDPNLTTLALARCFEILKETCPKAKFSSKLFDKREAVSSSDPIIVSPKWIKEMIGEDLGEQRILAILDGLGFVVKKKNSSWEIEIPTWRATKDIKGKEDIVEEVARIYGYDNLHSVMPLVPMIAPLENKERSFERMIKRNLSGGGQMSEVYNYSFVSEEKLKKLNIDSAGYIELANPISSFHTLLRQHLFVNMLDNVKTNQARYQSIKIFEVGNVYLDIVGNVNKDSDKEENLPYEEKRIGLLVSTTDKDDSYRSLKSKIQYLFESFNLNVSYESSEMMPNWAGKKTYASIKADGEDVGFIFKLENKTLSGLGLKKSTAVAELVFSKIFNLVDRKGSTLYQAPSRYPAIERDLAFVVDSKVLYNDIKREIEAFHDLITKVELFDVYQGGNLGKDKRNLAFHVTYQSTEKTLSSEEIDDIAKKLVKKLEEKFEAKVRDF